VEILNRDNKHSTTIHAIYKTDFTRRRPRPRPNSIGLRPVLQQNKVSDHITEAYDDGCAPKASFPYAALRTLPNYQ